MKRLTQTIFQGTMCLALLLCVSMTTWAQGNPPPGNKLQVKCIDSSGKPVSGVEVFAQIMPASPAVKSKTDRNGLAPFKDLANGAYRVYARGQGYAPAFQEPIRLGGGADQTVTLTFQAGDPTKKLYFEDPAMVKQANDSLVAGAEALQTRNFALAEEKLAAAVAIVPTNPDSHFYLGLAYFYQRKWDQAKAEVETAKRLNPAESRYQVALDNMPIARLVSDGQQAVQEQKYDVAIAKFSEVATLQPDNAENYYDLALAYAHAGQHGKATETIDLAIKLKPEEKSYEELKKIIANRKEAAKLEQAKALADEGDKLFQAKEYAPAIEKYKAAELLLSADTIPAVRFQIGRTYVRMGKTDEAITSFREAIEMKPDKAEYRQVLAEYYYQLGRTPEAMEMYIQYYQQTNKPVDEGLFGLAQKLSKESKGAQAATVLEKVLEINPQHAEAQYELGIYRLYDEKDKARAAELLAAYVKVGQNQEHVDNAKALLVVIKPAPAKSTRTRRKP